MKFYRKILLLTMIIFLIVPGSAPAAIYTDDQGLQWEVLEWRCVEEITGDNEGSLYLELNGAPAKINKDLKSSPEMLQPGEEYQTVTNREKNRLSEVDKNLIQLKEKTLYYQDIPVMDMGTYLEENERFYRENPDYTWTDIFPYAYEYNLEKGGKILQVITFVDGYIPPPYTPSYSDTLLIAGSTARKLDIDAGFRLTGVWENSDGSWWLEGWLKEWKTSKENSLFLVGNDLKVFSVNEVLQKNDIQVLGQGENSLIIRAETLAINPYFEADPQKYKVAGGGIYSLCSDGGYTRRKENIKNYKSIYLDRQDYIYAVSSDGKEIKNLTTGKGYRLEKATTPFEREMKKLGELDFQYQTQLARVSPDGSRWYLQDNRIVHEVKGKKSVFNQGLPVLMYPVENLFIDNEGGKWFLGPAGIAYYREDLMEALNINPLLDGGISPGDTENLYVDGNKRVWFFNGEIKCAPFQESTSIAPESGLILGFEQVFHKYSETKGEGIFIYQKEHPDGSYTARVLTIDREGKINHRDYPLDQKLLRYFVYDGKLHLVLPDGLLILEEDQVLTARNASLLEGLEFRYRDKERLVFSGRYRLVVVRF